MNSPEWQFGGINGHIHTHPERVELRKMIFNPFRVGDYGPFATPNGHSGLFMLDCFAVNCPVTAVESKHKEGKWIFFKKH